jgi:transposase
MKLTPQQIKQIPALCKSGLNLKTIAERFGVSQRAIQYWVKRYRKEGKEVLVKRGRPPYPLS